MGAPSSETASVWIARVRQVIKLPVRGIIHHKKRFEVRVELIFAKKSVPRARPPGVVGKFRAEFVRPDNRPGVGIVAHGRRDVPAKRKRPALKILAILTWTRLVPPRGAVRAEVDILAIPGFCDLDHVAVAIDYFCNNDGRGALHISMTTALRPLRRIRIGRPIPCHAIIYEGSVYQIAIHLTPLSKSAFAKNTRLRINTRYRFLRQCTGY